MRLLLSLTLLISSCAFGQDTTIYSFQADSINGTNKIDFSKFRTKKILIINTATLDKNFSQLHELTLLQQKHINDLVIVVFPSGDFGSEPSNNSVISSFLQKFKLNLIVAAKTSVKGTNISPLYNWITHLNLTGVSNLQVIEPYQKFLFDSSGNLINLFSAGTRPLSSAIENAITQ